ncbi:MAG TPA: hypothetical protein VFS40_16525 [Gemmatimonadales bacterium]|nr:hypothetical protein [Gemmatimonadales bacterium]
MIDQLFLLDSPYERLRLAKAGTLPLGTIIVADLTGDTAERPTAVLDAVALHRESPWCPICFVTDGRAPSAPLLEALAQVPGDPAWVAGIDGARPMAEDVAEAVRSRLSPDAERLEDFVTFRLGGAEALGATAIEATFADAIDADGDVDVDALRTDAGLPALDVVGWEAVVETALRRRGYVRGAAGSDSELTAADGL